MNHDPLLTQAEIDFIQHLATQTSRERRAPSDIGAQLGELLEQLGTDEYLSLDARSQDKHLSYPIRLIRKGRQAPRLEVGAPLILEPGEVERPWRLTLLQPLALLDGKNRPGGLEVIELSSNGMLVRSANKGKPAHTLHANLQLPDEACIHLQARLVRRVTGTCYAYRLQSLHDEDEQHLRQFLFDHHAASQTSQASA
ncbi:PilZ domain-containing protein [Pseudomonas sp. GOM7]|uniref:PilZ domain-containing protein n=1 Tax=unclassified Pseudomonas TaxID=196821 RepID=UPI00227CF799|nr:MULTISPECIES: PilZ domain-containing protein [unclassified Pseudomonas]WAJ36406.1 PilZ domain-containing protein [Pseudomonas sp. GOM7]